jgi:RHS repeat-associated protein
VTDALGSTRLVTDGSGTPTRCYDYLPFGEEIAAGTNGRPTGCYGAAVGSPSGPDVVSQKFTGQQRDTETGLDFFESRYFSGPQGRFSSADEPFADQDPSDPQSWNLYGYVRNNPLGNFDPSGHDCITATNQTETTVTATITPGACAGNSGAYVPGTVDRKSLTYNGTSIGYTYTPYDTNSLVSPGTAVLGRAPSDALSSFAQQALGQAGTWATDGSVFREGLPAMLQLLAMIDGVRAEGGSPNLRYRANPKHGETARGNVSPEPTNGAQILPNSVPIKSTSSARVGVDKSTGEYVMFRETDHRGEYHGYALKNFNDLPNEAKAALIKAGKVSQSGAIK